MGGALKGGEDKHKVANGSSTLVRGFTELQTHVIKSDFKFVSCTSTGYIYSTYVRLLRGSR